MEGEIMFYPKYVPEGKKDFINACIKKYQEQQVEPNSGAFGSTRKITLGGSEYYVKKMDSEDERHFEYFPNEVKRQIMFRTIATREIDIAFRLADTLPDVVSKIVGAKYTDRKQLIAYLIFEGLPGMDFHKFSQSKQPLEPIFACIEAKVTALHKAGYVHQDIKPSNIFIVTNPDGTFKDCRLIDLDTVQFEDDLYEDAGTNGYLPEIYSEERKKRYNNRNHTILISPKQNLHAIHVMKKELRGGSRKAKRNRKTRKTK